MDEAEEPKIQADADKGSIGRRPPTRIGADSEPPIGSVCSACKSLVFYSEQILPYMAVYVCSDCKESKKRVPIFESEIENKIFAPWTQSQVDAINEYQRTNYFLPFVCSFEHILIADREGLHCEKCPAVHVFWTYSWISEGDWTESL